MFYPTRRAGRCWGLPSLELQCWGRMESCSSSQRMGLAPLPASSKSHEGKRRESSDDNEKAPDPPQKMSSKAERSFFDTFSFPPYSVFLLVFPGDSLVGSESCVGPWRLNLSLSPSPGLINPYNLCRKYDLYLISPHLHC